MDGERPPKQPKLEIDEPSPSTSGVNNRWNRNQQGGSNNTTPIVVQDDIVVISDSDSESEPQFVSFERREDSPRAPVNQIVRSVGDLMIMISPGPAGSNSSTISLQHRNIWLRQQAEAEQRRRHTASHQAQHQAQQVNNAEHVEHDEVTTQRVIFYEMYDPNAPSGTSTYITSDGMCRITIGAPFMRVDNNNENNVGLRIERNQQNQSTMGANLVSENENQNNNQCVNQTNNQTANQNGTQNENQNQTSNVIDPIVIHPSIFNQNLPPQHLPEHIIFQNPSPQNQPYQHGHDHLILQNSSLQNSAVNIPLQVPLLQNPSRNLHYHHLIPEHLIPQISPPHNHRYHHVPEHVLSQSHTPQNILQQPILQSLLPEHLLTRNFSQSINQTLRTAREFRAILSFINSVTVLYDYKDNPRADLEQKKCVICLGDFEDEQQIRRLPCLHIFHRPCIDSWLVPNRKCPVCRNPLNIYEPPGEATATESVEEEESYGEREGGGELDGQEQDDVLVEEEVIDTEEDNDNEDDEEE